MEVSEVRKRILDTLTRAKGEAAARRARNAEAATAYERFLETVCRAAGPSGRIDSQGRETPVRSPHAGGRREAGLRAIA